MGVGFCCWKLKSTSILRGLAFLLFFHVLGFIFKEFSRVWSLLWQMGTRLHLQFVAICMCMILLLNLCFFTTFNSVAYVNLVAHKSPSNKLINKMVIPNKAFPFQLDNGLTSSLMNKSPHLQPITNTSIPNIYLFIYLC